jgi:pyridoxal phosphate enzyme (YggS family)
MLTPEQIGARVREAHDRIAAAAARAGRSADAVTLVAATKTQPPTVVAAALAAGVDELGENYVQEAAAKRPAVGQPARWRLIGPLQRNKAGAALALFDTIDTLADLRVAQALARRCEQRGGAPREVLVEVHLGEEPTKAGVAPAAAEELLVGLQLLPGLRCLGLMTMPPPVPADEGRRYFAALASLARELAARTGLALPVLSMGMSHDYEVAIEEGATHVRLGTALFGPRG